MLVAQQREQRQDETREAPAAGTPVSARLQAVREALGEHGAVPAAQTAAAQGDLYCSFSSQRRRFSPACAHAAAFTCPLTLRTLGSVARDRGDAEGASLPTAAPESDEEVTYRVGVPLAMWEARNAASPAAPRARVRRAASLSPPSRRAGKFSARHSAGRLRPETAHAPQQIC